MKKYFIYILKCSDDSYYVGVTSDLLRRIKEHESGKYHKSYTFKRRPVQLVYFEEIENVKLAISREKQIKKWSRFKKEALIKNEFDELPKLSKKNFK
ncbi:GIY-YIG nuclease family protein [Tenacibaculum sp. 190524A05c]|uniref:Endonuclease n=1 Tax=Tenacibaculum platacis TaxID=3137852 RepID=A0ABM9P306_9FLAO